VFSSSSSWSDMIEAPLGTFFITFMLYDPYVNFFKHLNRRLRNTFKIKTSNHNIWGKIMLRIKKFYFITESNCNLQNI
jgi:hypothetical protein